MRKSLMLVLLMLIGCMGVMAQTMSDEQVLQYVRQANSQGKDQQQIAAELVQQGVTQQQLLRIQSQYAAGQGGQGSSGNAMNDSESRMRTSVAVENEGGSSSSGNNIFGHNIFNNANLNFEPSANIATPTDYVLGPGDEVVIDIWGASENTIRGTISPDGVIQISNLGPVYLSGKTIKEANAYIKQELSKIYSGVTGDDPTTQINLTLGSNRSISVNVMGEVRVPGTYTLSAFASVFHALYAAGGVNSIGTLRAIKLVRNNKTIATVDIYQYIMDGNLTSGERLQEGDVIIVPTYQVLVRMGGNVKRPMYYEMKTNESLSTALEFAGGFSGDAYRKSMRVNRQSSGFERQIYNVDEMDYSVFVLNDGDVVTAGSVLDRYENRVEVRGAVYRPGAYELDGQMNTVKQLIQKADGLLENAFLNRAILSREKDDLSREIISIDLRGLMDGTVADIPLKRNDVLNISTVQGLEETKTVAIHGMVASAGTYGYADNMTIEDLIVMAGGLLESASQANVSVTRRIKDPMSMEYTGVLGETYTVEVDGDLQSSAKQFKLEPFDEVYIRRSPAYRAQQNVVVRGEVLFAGSYAKQSVNERISSVIKRAGGVTADGYVHGARLIRHMTDDEIAQRRAVMRSVYAQLDVSMRDSLMSLPENNATTYNVGIDLEKALANPGGNDDLVLRAGDIIDVPAMVNTVKISGGVLYPNTVTYVPGKSTRYYISQAGGYALNAKKSRMYVVRVNGTVSKLKKSSVKKIEPGSEIVVPTKERRARMSLAEVMGMSTAGASMAAIVATIISLFK